jgi:putative ATPase
VKELRAVIAEAKTQKTVLFIDEIHRFNKAQQDAFLPVVEDGTIILIGATTENPSFSVNNALLSRLRVYKLEPLTEADLKHLLAIGLKAIDRGASEKTDEELMVNAADGDARRLFNLLELADSLAPANVALSNGIIIEAIGTQWRQFDKQGDNFYDQISALHKAVRGSSPNGALYWLARMLDGGVDRLFLARRIVRMASEDIGNADPRALTIANDAWTAFERLGSPEGELALAQAVAYLACAPKSNAVYRAFQAAQNDVSRTGSLPVPVHLRNAPTKLMKQLDHGKDYRYDHDQPGAFSLGQTYFPDKMGEKIYYEPVNRGLEIKIGEKLKALKSTEKS